MHCKEKYEKIREVLRFFEEISAVPRGSGNTKGIADYLVGFATERGLDYYRDNADNVIIRKAATEGFESRPTVIIQGHTDIVAEKTPDADIDMEREGVRLVYEGEFLHADKTTLGGDDGIAVAYALALLDSDSIPHPALEAVFTSDEEIGLIGATAIDPNEIKGRLMINIDSDDEGIFTVGCAGGVRCDIELAVKREGGGKEYSLTVGGLQGGHSGMEIDKGRVNAIKALGELLAMLGDIRLSAIDGGNADNAIPRDAVARFVTSEEVTDEKKEMIASYLKSIKAAEPDAKIELVELGDAAEALDKESTEKIVELLTALPTGVIGMMEDIPGLVETSLNMGITKLADSYSLSFSVRSAKGARKDELVDKLRQKSLSLGAKFSTRGDYPAWEYRKESHLRDVMCEVYERMYNKSAKVVTIHAGLECGIFSDKLEGLDCVSIGPDGFDIHTPKESLSLPSAERVWVYLTEVLKSV